MGHHYAIGIEWDWIGFLMGLIFVGLPVGIITFIITYFAVRFRFKKKIDELKKQIEKLENENSTK
ncbi:bZIP transcription factor [Brevibacillus sp. BC25]|uniref:bZIP transcription factor n=1 Tax=Brevibacillus sp. BC25 TaxID=1144308 RepID=UPI00027146B0|nr:bZIP transcription factor [Brevibacillus sp. BC25]EJL31965.1 hypothetical protein PMI05_00482 [Brevibacillus sp. BC25]